MHLVSVKALLYSGSFTRLGIKVNKEQFLFLRNFWSLGRGNHVRQIIGGNAYNSMVHVVQSPEPCTTKGHLLGYLEYHEGKPMPRQFTPSLPLSLAALSLLRFSRPFVSRTLLRSPAHSQP